MTQEEALREIGEAIDYMTEIFPATSKLTRDETWSNTVLVITALDGSRFGITCSPLMKEELDDQ